MSGVRLRPVRREDLPLLYVDHDEDPIDTFGYMATNALERDFNAGGLIGYDQGTLVIQDAAGAVAGKVTWRPVPHGPTSASYSLNIGTRLLPAFRGRGLATVGTILVATYLFETTTFERLQAETDVTNVAAQRSLAKAGFTREGIARHAQFRKGAYHDLVVYSRLRDDPAPSFQPR